MDDRRLQGGLLRQTRAMVVLDHIHQIRREAPLFRKPHPDDGVRLLEHAPLRLEDRNPLGSGLVHRLFILGGVFQDKDHLADIMEKPRHGDLLRILDPLLLRNRPGDRGATHGMVPEPPHDLLHDLEDRDPQQEALDNVESQEHDRVRYGRDPSGEAVDGGIDHLEDFRRQGRVTGDEVADLTKGNPGFPYDLGDLLERPRRGRQGVDVFNLHPLRSDIYLFQDTFSPFARQIHG